ncbi:hypothetical protein GCM10009759_16940 [Kitasatospora saccharophila]|uniref:PknH-like protein n=1 Tax=Kitasatospora saccharophila TaxID=407973 RepID=A0ABN2WGF3_9ACTN
MTVRARKTALRIAALGAAALVLTACNDDGSSSDPGLSGASAPHSAAASPTAHASPTGKGKLKEPEKNSKSGAAAGGTKAGDAKAAQAKTDQLALTAEEWDNAYVSSGEDNASTDNFVMSASCEWGSDGTQVKGLSAATWRYVQQDHESDSTYAITTAEQFTAAADAHREIQKFRDNDKRCPDYKDADTDSGAGTQYSGVHAGTAPAVPGADEVYVEEGKNKWAYEDGTWSDSRDFVYLMARKGTVVVMVYMDVDPHFNARTSKDQARDALATLATKW